MSTRTLVTGVSLAALATFGMIVNVSCSSGSSGGPSSGGDASTGGNDAPTVDVARPDGGAEAGPPAVCALGGYDCSSTPCCSGTCNAGVCVCTEPTGNCQKGSDCCSGVCADGVCASCNGMNEACDESANCCGGSCKDNACACVPTGNPCTTFTQQKATDCCTGACYLNDAGAPVCEACGPVNTACSPSIGCCNGLACLNSNDYEPDAGATYCYASVGTACEKQTDCSSQNCTDHVCACGTPAEDFNPPCLQDSDCCTGSTCSQGLCQ